MNSKSSKLLLVFDILMLIAVLIGGIGFWKYKGNCIQISIDKIRSLSPEWKKPGKYWETSKYHTPNLHKGRNEIKAVVLHHTAGWGSGEAVAQELCSPKRGASCHVVIDTDGTRYVIANPEEIPFSYRLLQIRQ